MKIKCTYGVYNGKLPFSPWLQGNPRPDFWIFALGQQVWLSGCLAYFFFLVFFFTLQLPSLFSWVSFRCLLMWACSVSGTGRFASVQEVNAWSSAWGGGGTEPREEDSPGGGRGGGELGGAASVKGEQCRAPLLPRCPQIERLCLWGSEWSLIFSYLVWLISTSW